MCLGLPRPQLCRTPSNGSCIYGTQICEVRRLKIKDGKMAKEPRDSQRKNELTTGCRILIDIYKGEYEVKMEVYRDIL